ncbi:MAG: AAA family ATPase, partial [Nitrosopumilus sp.]
MLYLAENKKIILIGIPGVGKTTLLSKIVETVKDHDKSIIVISYGTLMFDVAKANGLSDRDELRKLPVSEQ